MKRALIPAILLSMSILSACSMIVPAEIENGEQEMVEAAFSANTLGSAKKNRKGHDATAFLVGEFYVSNGYTAFFDGRGAVTMVAPDGSSIGGYYTLQEEDEKSASVIINFGQGDESYRYDLISGSGDFTLTDKDNNLLVFVLKTYE